VRRRAALVLPVVLLVLAGAYLVVQEAGSAPTEGDGLPAARVNASHASGGEAGMGVTVAVVGQGVDADDPALAESLVDEVAIGPADEPGNASPSAHAMRVAATAAGDPVPGEGHPGGIAPGAGLLSLDISGRFTAANAVRAFAWLAEHGEEHEIDVVVSAWGRVREQARYAPEDPLVRASDRLVDQGMVVVFPTGNAGPEPSRMNLEAMNPDVLGVGAVSPDGEVATYSGRGPVHGDEGAARWTKPDLVAPGTWPRSANGEAPAGTSLAAPQVAGAAALVLAEHPELTPDQVRHVLVASADDVAGSGVDERSGAGRLDVGAALQRAEAGVPSDLEARGDPEVVAPSEADGQEGGLPQAATARR